MLGTTEIRIIPDWTILIEIVVFLFVILVLNALVLRPMLRVMDKRKAFTIDASDEAGKLNQEADQLEAGRREVLAMAIREAQAERDEKTQKTLREADRIKAEARSKMDEMISSSEVSIEQSGDRSIVEEMSERSRELSDVIVRKVEG